MSRRRLVTRESHWRKSATARSATVQFPSGGPRCVIAVSRVMCGVLDLIRRIAASQATIVLLEGESGVDKNLVANEFDRLSD